MTTTAALTTTIEYVADEAHEGPAILIHATTGPYHAQDNPGSLVASFDAADGVTDDMTTAEIAALAGVEPGAMTLVSEGHADCWEMTQ